MYRLKPPSTIPFAAAALTSLLWAAPVAAANPEPSPDAHESERPPSPRTHVGISTQFVEIVGLSPSVHHTTALLAAGLTVAHTVAPRWTLIGGLSFATGIDSTSLGGSATVAADYQLYRKEAFRFGVGPDLTLVQSRVKMGPAGWGNVTVVGPGAGFTAGYRGATLNLGLGTGYTPQFGGGWSLAPHAGIGASF